MANHHEKPPQVVDIDAVGTYVHLPQPNGEEPYPPEHHDATLGIGDHNADDVIEFESNCAAECAEGCLCKAKLQEDELTPMQKRYLALSKNLGDGDADNVLAAVTETPVHAAAKELIHNNALLDEGQEKDPFIGPIDWDEWDQRAKATLSQQVWDAHGNNPKNSGNPKDLLGDTKPNLALVPPAASIYMALAMGDGAKKYGPYNWREKEVRAMVYVAAALRHINAYLDGEDHAEDSHKPHLAHALACLGILADATETGNLIDDRPAEGAAAELIDLWTDKQS
jgi:hypothetical protein